MIADYSSGIEINNHAQIHPSSFNFKVCKVTDPDFIWAIGRKFPFHDILLIPFPAKLVLLLGVCPDTFQSHFFHICGYPFVAHVNFLL